MIRRAIVGACGLLLAWFPASEVEAAPRITQIILKGSANTILGLYFAAGLGFELSAGTTLALGISYTERMGFEPLIRLSRMTALPSGWTMTLTLSRGDFGGDYRVDRLPEITLARSRPIGATGFTYSLEAGVGHFVVQPTDLSGVRGALVGQVAAPRVSLGPVAGLIAITGYRYYVYAGGTAHGAWWGLVQLSVTPVPALAGTITYLRQVPSGSSPLLFDGMGDENLVAGAASLRVSPTVALSHSQTYSFLAQTITARVYSVSVSLPRGYTVGIAWDQVPGTWSASFSFQR